MGDVVMDSWVSSVGIHSAWCYNQGPLLFWDVSGSNVMQLNEVICEALLHCRLLQESWREKAPPELLRLERQAACNLLPSFPLGFLYGASEIKPWALSPGVTGVSSPNSLICERTFFNFVLF